MKDLGEVLDMRIDQRQDERRISVDQEEYIKKNLDEVYV